MSRNFKNNKFIIFLAILLYLCILIRCQIPKINAEEAIENAIKKERFFRHRRNLKESPKPSKGKIIVNNNNNNDNKESFNSEPDGFQNYDYPIGPVEYSQADNIPTEEKLKVYRDKVYEMFHSSYDSYVKNAYPEDELRPISCTGVNTWGNFSLTLIDALDTFGVMNDIKGFEDALEKVKKINFDMDINISVFETTIRVLGGLLSSHLMAKDFGDKITYHDELLTLADDLGQRLLPAFDTPTGMPFGSVNLKKGVHPNETTVTCTATIGTCSVEFTWLSILTNNPIYEFTCRRAIHSLWSHRTSLGLIGAHIDVFTGMWTEAAFSISGGVDSFYEYLLKSWIGFTDETEYGEMFLEMYELIHQYLRREDGWHIYANPYNGMPMMDIFQSLGAYWPGVKILAGELIESNDELYLLSDYLKDRSFLPERFHVDNLNRKGYDYINYPLRPELVESLSVMYKATKDPKLLKVAFQQVDRIIKWCKTTCGYANIKNVYTVEKEDKMESFFLSETLKYLYLLFDPDNKYNKNYIFSTEAHPFPVVKSNKSQATEYYRKKTKDIRKELRKCNAKHDANRYFMIRNKDIDCQIEHWKCTPFQRYHISPKADNEGRYNYYKNYLNPLFHNKPKGRDIFIDFRKGICSYQHWVEANMMGLEIDMRMFI